MHDVINIARQKPRLRQFRYEHEKTKKGQITPSPHAEAASECTPAQMQADIAASGTSRFVTNDRIQRIGAISRVSNGGPTTTSISRMKSGSPSKDGALSSVIIPEAARRKTIINEGKKLIIAERRIYLRIETRVSKSIESSHPRRTSTLGVSCRVSSCSGSTLCLMSFKCQPLPITNNVVCLSYIIHVKGYGSCQMINITDYSYLWQ